MPVPLGLNCTVSPATGPDEFVTVAVIVEVAEPLAKMNGGVAATATALPVGVGFCVWSINAVPDAPVVVSVAVTVQNPGVVEDV
jgi:hypothetical protein